MAAYTERQFVQALVPLLISRLPDPFSPTKEDMLNVAKSATHWAGLLIDLRADSVWEHLVLDCDGAAWNESAAIEE